MDKIQALEAEVLDLKKRLDRLEALLPWPLPPLKDDKQPPDFMRLYGGMQSIPDANKQ